MPILPPSFRSSKGRRPPYNGFVNKGRIDKMLLEDIELYHCVDIDEFDDGTIGGLKRWVKELEKHEEWLYEPGSPCLVDPAYPNQHVRHLSEAGFSVRAEGTPAIASSARSLLSTLESSFFQDRYIKPWTELSKDEQEKIVIGVFVNYERSGPDQTKSIGRLSKLCPELMVSRLLGQGLIDLTSNLRKQLVDPNKLSTFPIPNAKFFKKFGIDRTNAEVPPSRADRAFQEEYLLKRHALLFNVVHMILRKINGEEMKISGSIGNTASEMARMEQSEYNDQSSDSPGIDYFNLVSEKCTSCKRTAEAAGLKRLLYCDRCNKVNRIIPYCSADCQKSDWKNHKAKSCGKAASSFHEVPIISTQAPPPVSTSLPPDRLLVKMALESVTHGTWAYFDPNAPRSITGEGIKVADSAQERRIRKAMRALAFKALETNDRVSIELLAAAMYSADPTLLDLGNGSKMSDNESKYLSQGDRINQFREIFDIATDEAWKETMARGAVEIEKPGREFIKEYRDCKKEQAISDQQLEALLDSYIPTPPDAPDGFRDFARALSASLLGVSAGRPM